MGFSLKGGIAGSLLGGAVMGPAGSVLGGAFGSKGGIGGLRDSIFGKKDPGTEDRFIDLEESLKQTTEGGRNAQQVLTGYLRGDLDRFGANSFNEGGEKALARMALARQEKALGSQVGDQKRLASQLIAQRGLGGTSTGLNAILTAGRDAQNQQAALRAQSPILQKQALDQARDAFENQRLSRLTTTGQSINSILGAPGAQRAFVQGRDSTGRNGGILGMLAPIAGAAIGGKMGGAQGAATGMQIGQGFGQSASNF